MSAPLYQFFKKNRIYTSFRLATIAFLNHLDVYDWYLYGKEKRKGQSLEGIRYQRRLEEFYAPFITPGEVCFDVGANLGTRVQAFLNLGAQVVAVEPQRLCYKVLHRKFSNNGHAILVNKALGDQSGEAEFIVCNYHPRSSLSTEFLAFFKENDPTVAYVRTEKVDLTTLDLLIQEYGLPGFCKIDVEGYEAQVLAGLSQPIRGLSFEYHAQLLDNAYQCIDKLMTLGDYEYNYSPGESFCFGLPHWVSAEKLKGTLQGNLKPHEIQGDVYARLKA